MSVSHIMFKLDSADMRESPETHFPDGQGLGCRSITLGEVGGWEGDVAVTQSGASASCHTVPLFSQDNGPPLRGPRVVTEGP